MNATESEHNGHWDVATGVGRTALGVAAARAVETNSPDRLIEDPYASHLAAAGGLQVPPPGAPATAGDPAWSFAARFLGVRSRRFDEHLMESVRAGIEQIVLLGAGLDARSARMDWPASVHLFEVDQPRVLAFKQTVLADAGATTSAHWHLVPADLREEWGQALRDNGFDPTRPTAWLAEGLLPYLPAQAEADLFDTICRLSAPGSTFAGDWMSAENTATVTSHPAFHETNAKADAELDTLWNTEPRDRSPEEALGAAGWQVTDRSAAELAQQYGRELTGPVGALIGLTTVATAILPTGNHRTTTTHEPVGAVRELAAALDPSRVSVPGAAAEESWRLFNGAIDHVPAVVVRCTSAADVQTAVRVARTHGLPLSVRGGGHDWAGRAVRPGGMLLDLAGMRGVTVDRAAQVATVAGGALSRDVIAAAAPHGLVAVTGTIGDVGMAGLTLGGGYGPLNGRYGLALDNLMGADVVLADGTLVSADETEHPELYWALRGGGGNFGVVTELRIKLHPVEQVLGGFIVYPWQQAEKVLHRLSEVLATAPDELTVLSGIMPGPDGSPTVLLSPAWSGPPADGGSYLAALQSLGEPLFAQIGPMPYAKMLSLFDESAVPGRHTTVRTRTVAGYTPELVAALLVAGETRTSPFSAVGLHHFHGAPTRVPVGSTAFGIRTTHLSVEIAAVWEPEDDPAPHQAWADATSTAIAAVALPGGYANMLGPDHHEQIAHAYGPHATRLRAVKSSYDPDGVFTAIPLPLEA